MATHDHHHHTHSAAITQANQRSFQVGIALNLAFVAAEAVAGIRNGSLALLTDAGHNLSDVASLALSLLAFRLARRKATATHTYGFKKTTILAALANAVLLLVALGVLGYESVRRLLHPEPVAGGTIAWVAGAGILVNSISAWLFYRRQHSDLNVKGAYLHLLADALVSVGVVVAGVLITYTHWYWLDPVIGLAIMVVILFSTWSLLRDSFRLAVDAVPPGLSVPGIVQAMRAVEGVEDVCHVHVWPLSTTETALTAHVVVAEELSLAATKEVLARLRHELEHQGIHHSTLELETKSCRQECLPADPHSESSGHHHP